MAGQFARLAVAVAKYWINKRLPSPVYEAMECLGGSGYVEESILPRLYREAPLNSIWEGAGNVIALDVLRALSRSPEAADVFVDELRLAGGADAVLDGAIDALAERLRSGTDEVDARRLVEQMAKVWSAALLTRHTPSALADAFTRTRLGGDGGAPAITPVSTTSPSSTPVRPSSPAVRSCWAALAPTSSKAGWATTSSTAT